MRSRYLFLLIYFLGSFYGASSEHRNSTCTKERCKVPDPTSRFLQCVGLPSTDTGRDHMKRLKGMLEAAMDVYTFMRSSLKGVPLFGLQGELTFNPKADPFQNEALVQMWLEVKIKPLLKSVTKNFLTCLSAKSFSCHTYQIMVRELSYYYSEMHPVRQKWIYTFFMYPFLSGDRVAGCVSPHESSEEWLMKNFGAFKAMARMKDLTTLNMVFSGLEVLHLLSPAQKAELLMMPGVAGMNDSTLSLVFHNLLTGSPGPHTTKSPGGGHPWTSPGDGHNLTSPGGGQPWTHPGGGHNSTSPGGGQPWTSPGGGHNSTSPGGGQPWTHPGGGHNSTSPGGGQPWTHPGGGHNSTSPGGGDPWTHPEYSTHPTYDPYAPPSPHHSLRQVVNGFMTAFKPIGSFVHDFVSFTKERDVSDIRSTTLTQFLLNWTLSELADMYRQPNTSVLPEKPKFDVTNVEDWYRHVVMPVLRRFLPNDGALMHQNIKLAFHQLFHLDNGNATDIETSEIQDVCSISLKNNPCGLTDVLKNVAKVLNCSATSNLTMSEETVMRLIVELTERLNSLIKELSTNFKEVASDFQQIFGEVDSQSLTQEHLEDPEYIKLWFQIKVAPLLNDLPSPHVVPKELLSCLSTKNFSCPVYQTILQEFIHHYNEINENNDSFESSQFRHVVANEFIIPFLSGPHSGEGCVSLSNGSADWLMKNLGPFSAGVSVQQLLLLNPQFKPLEVLRLLTAYQTAELLILPTPPEKDAIINKIFDHLTESPDESKLTDFLSAIPYVLTANVSCSSYRTLFTRMDLVLPTASPSLFTRILHIKMELSRYFIPPGCIIYSGECNVTMTNETDICVGVNSTMLQLHLDSGRMNGRFCDFAVEEFACASLAALKAEDLAAVLACNRSSNSSSSRPVWKLLLSHASPVLDKALDLLSNTTLDPRNPALSMILDSIREIRLDLLGNVSLNSPAIIQQWFKRRLRPFLPAVSPDFLSCLTTRGLNCITYQHIVKILSHLQPHMTLARQYSVYTHFIKIFLSDTDSSCSSNITDSGDWLQKNLGGFSVLVSFYELRMLYPDFVAMEALPQLTVRQLARMSATPGQLNSSAQVAVVMRHIPDKFLAAFFDIFSPGIMGKVFPRVVRSAMLEVVFDRANLSNHSVGDSVVSLWLHNRLRPLLIDLSPQHVAPFFRILAGRNCSIEQLGIESLNSSVSPHDGNVRQDIRNHIIQTLKGPIPLRCYGDNNNHSFYRFLEGTFMGFKFPNLTTFISLMPHDRMHQLVNSMPPSDLGDLLRRPDTVHDNAELCVIYNNYIETPLFLETESLPEDVRRLTLPCVWPRALSSSERSEVNAWFDRRLNNYLSFLTKSLISPNNTHNASCLAFQKLVSVLGEYNYTSNVKQLQRRDVFNTIKAYLTSATVPRCYNSSDPELNSTAWFVEYIGPFISFLTLEDLQMFGSATVIQVFTVNPLNLALLNHSVLPFNLTKYYTELIYLQDSNFNPLLLPLLFRCIAPGPAFSQLTSEQSIIVLHNLTTLCTDLDPQVSAALAGNLGDNIDATAISALGSESTGLSNGQINMIKPEDLFAALGTLSSVNGWNGGQAKAIIRSLMGIMKINSTSSLLMLGSLVVGVPADAFSSISGSQLITASQNSAFLGHIMRAPQIVQETFVAQIISVDSNSENIIQNVPDDLATQIPRALLLGFSNNASIISKLNQKKWEQQQVELFFQVIAQESATTALGSPNNLSSSVLQGFTCTSVRTFAKRQIRKLIKACRRTGTNKVTLVETQLTCMYNHIKDEADATSFNLYPPDMLLYYDYTQVPQASCRSYFQELAVADFYVFSSALNYKQDDLFVNARSCLGITNTSLTEDNVSVLGNMCCTVDGTYIENSDPSILEKLKKCPDLSNTQAAAVEALLQSGNTQYGAPSTWNEQTLRDLGMLPLYLTSTFYNYFDRQTKRSFLEYFLGVIKNNGVDRQKRKTLKAEIRNSMKNRRKRSIVNECTVGEITQVTISDATFPFNYDITQFNCCLSATTVKDNLNALTDQVDNDEYLKIILSKLREAYAASTIPEAQVQLLGPASRVATTDDINMWTITQIDTLSALMDSSDGAWDPTLAKAIISKYLSHAGNTLGSSELNAIGGANLCSLDANDLKNISQQSLREADALTVSSCTIEKKRELFTIARQAFSTSTRSTTVTASAYQLTQAYLGGATSDYIRTLSASNVSMDLATFTSLDPTVVQNLTVDDVKNLLGTNLPDLKSYENQTLVQDWIRSQPQPDLDMLMLGLIGGRAINSTTNSPTTASAMNTTAGAATTASAMNTTAGAATTASVMNTTAGAATTAGSMNTTAGAATTASVMNTTAGAATTASAMNTTAAAATTASAMNTTAAAATTASAMNTTAAAATTASAVNTTAAAATTASAMNTTAGAATTASAMNTTAAAPTTTNPVTTGAAPTTTNPVTTGAAPTTNPVTTGAAPTTNPVTTGAAPITNPVTTGAAPTTNPVTTGTAPTTNPVTTGAAPTTTNPVTTAATPTTTNPVTTTTTTGDGSRIRAEAGFSFLVLLALLIVSLV